MLIRMNMATSLDGKIASEDRVAVKLGTDADICRLDELRAWADILVVGAGTVRAEDPPMEIKDPDACRARISMGRPGQPAVAVLTRSMGLAAGRTFSTSGRCLVVTTEEADEPAPDLSESVEIWRIGKGKIDIPAFVDRLNGEGMERVLIEGGGMTAASFFEYNLIDEVFITLTRWVVGGDDAPSIADAAGVFEPMLRYELIDVESTTEEMFLHYRKQKEKI